MQYLKYIKIIGALFLPAMLALPAQGQARPELRWYKGNTHTHTWWSDGDSPPEVVVGWYKDHGYNFLILSDHNILSDHEKWLAVTGGARKEAAERYEKSFGPEWVEKRVRDGKTEYRLKTLTEFRSLFEVAGEFMLIQGEEISDEYDKAPVHVNGVNLKKLIPPQGGNSMLETMQKNIDAVYEQEKETGQPMFPHLNHPNFHWANPVEDIMRLRGDQLFEVHNGHPGVNNYGDSERLSTERIWDICLARRLSDLKLPVLYGLATDDAHAFLGPDPQKSNPGRGWIMVRSRYLTPQHIVEAVKRGDFYASSGVLLDDIRFADGTLALRIQPRDGVSYKTQFIGTLTDYRTAEPGTQTPGDRVNSKIGVVFKEVEGLQPEFKLTGRELYVRAKVSSTARHPNPYRPGDVETAWTQPVRPTGAPSAR